MKRIFLPFGLLIVGLCGCATYTNVQSDYEPFDNSVFNVIIPHIKVKDVTIEEAVRVLEGFWKKELSGRNPPETIFVRHIWSKHSPTYPISKVSFDEKNISVNKCLQLISRAASLDGFKIKRGKIIITYSLGFSEDWATDFIPVTDRSKQFLKLSDQTTTDDLTSTLKQYGIKFREDFSATWCNKIDNIVITTFPEEIDKLKALLALIEEGYEIRKMPNKGIEHTR